jgi:hypothetical protein
VSVRKSDTYIHRRRERERKREREREQPAPGDRLLITQKNHLMKK